MNDTVDSRVGSKNLVKRYFVGQVGLVEGGTLPADKFDAVECDFGRIVKVINNDHVVTGLKKG